MPEVPTSPQPEAFLPSPEQLLTRMEANVRLGDKMNPDQFLKDTFALHQTGQTQLPEIQNLLKDLGNHPPLWNKVLDFLETSTRAADSDSIRQYLDAGRLLGMDQNPQISPLFEALDQYTVQVSAPKVGQPAEQAQPAPLERRRQEEDESLSVFTQYAQEQGIKAGTKQEYEAWLEEVAPMATQLKVEQLTQLPPYLLLRLMTDGRLKPEQIIKLPINTGEVLSQIMGDRAQKGVASLVDSYRRIDEILRRYTDDEIPSSMSLGELEVAAKNLQMDIKAGVPRINFNKGVILAWLPGQVERRKVDAQTSLDFTLSDIKAVWRTLEFYERSFNPPLEPDNKPPEQVVPPAPRAEPVGTQGEAWKPGPQATPQPKEDRMAPDPRSNPFEPVKVFTRSYFGVEHELPVSVIRYIPDSQYRPYNQPYGLGEWAIPGAINVPDRVRNSWFPPQPRKWVEIPEKDQLMVLKTVGETNVNIRLGTLSKEREALLIAQQVFAKDAKNRPVRLSGYGLLQPKLLKQYLLEEYLNPDEFKPIDSYVQEKGGALTIKEALEITLGVCEVVRDLHERGLSNFDTTGLEGDSNIFWDPLNKRVRLIDMETVEFSSADNRILGWRDRAAMAGILFYMITGQDISQLTHSLSTENMEKIRQLVDANQEKLGAVKGIIEAAMGINDEYGEPYFSFGTRKMHSQLAALVAEYEIEAKI